VTLEQLLDKLVDWCFTHGLRLILGVIFLVIGWKIINKLLKSLDKVIEKRTFDPTLHSFLRAISNAILKIILAVSLAGYVGIDTASFAAMITSAGLAVGLALQGSLSNFAGGVILLFMRPFSVGDFIETAGHSGRVEHIKLFYTYLLTPDNKEIMIPNGSIANSSIVNYSMRDTRRVDVTFGVAYEDNVYHVKKVLWDIVNSDSRILKDPEPFISISEHADNSVNFIVRAWTKTDDYWDVHFYLLEEAKIKFDEENISIPYPQMDIHMK